MCQVAAATVALSAATAGGVVGYSSVDPDFRKMVEDTIPGADQVMDLVIGEKLPPPPPPPVKAAPSKLKISSPVVITMPKEEKQELAIKEESPEEVSPPPSPPAEALSVPPPPLEVPVPAEEKVEIVDERAIEETKPDIVEEVKVADDAVVETIKAVEEPVKAQEEEPQVLATEEVIPEPAKIIDVVEDVPKVEVAQEIVPEAAKEDVPESVEQDVPEAVKEEIPKATKEDVAIVDKEEAPEVEKEKVAEDVAVETVSVEAVESVKEDVTEDATSPEDPIVLSPTHDIENSSLELMLGELCQEMLDVVRVTVDDMDAAAKAVGVHIQLMEKVLESNISAKDESAWNEMFIAAKTKSDKNRTAENSEKRAKVAIANVVESIAAGRKNKITATNPKILAAEEAANKALYTMDQAKVKRAYVESEAKIMEEYRDLVEASKEEFQKEMASIMPDVRLGEKHGKLTEEELNMFITHAYRKVVFLQQELAKVTTIEQERFRKALEKQRLETTSLAVDQLDSELEKQARELGVEHERRLAAIREEAEAELRVQMKRQAAAHADHIADVLGVQEAEISRKFSREIQEAVEALTSKYNTSLASLSGEVAGLRGGLEARAGADERSFSAQSLWVASNRLNAIVTGGNTEADTWEAKLAPLGAAVNMVKSVAGSGDTFVSTVAASIPSLALERGVYTEDGLKERFCGVEKVARRVAGVGDQGGSLLTFGLSYLQSVLLADLTQRAPAESAEVVDLASATSYDLLSLARHNLDRGDLAKAVQLLTQLRGEAGRVSSDWLAEARLTLETQQAVSAILAHSLANSCNSMIAK